MLTGLSPTRRSFSQCTMIACVHVFLSELVKVKQFKPTVFSKVTSGNVFVVTNLFECISAYNSSK